LIKAGFSRDNLNSISNLISIPILLLTIYTSTRTSSIGLKKLIISCILVQCILYMTNINLMSLNFKWIIVTQFIAQLCINIKNMMIYIMISSFPIHALTGMFVTIMYSFWNISENKTINTLLIDAFGWKICAFIGVFVQIIIIIVLCTYLFEWV